MKIKQLVLSLALAFPLLAVPVLDRPALLTPVFHHPALLLPWLPCSRMEAVHTVVSSCRMSKGAKFAHVPRQPASRLGWAAQLHTMHAARLPDCQTARLPAAPVWTEQHS